MNENNERASRKGDRVMIYDDPITRKQPEGMATIVRFNMRDYGFAGDGESYIYADVELDSEPGEIFMRWFRESDAHPA